MPLKILIIKTSSLGDIVQTFPVISYLRKRFPDAEIDWVVEAHFAELVAAHPSINRVLTIESKKWRRMPVRSWSEYMAFRHALRQTVYDFVFDLQGNVKSSALLLHIRAKEKIGFGWKAVPEWPNVLFTSQKITPPRGENIRQDYLAVVQGFFVDKRPFKIEPVKLRISGEERAAIEKVLSDAVLVFPGASWPNKQLEESQLLPFLKELDKGPYLFAWGTEPERVIASNLAAHFPSSTVLERYSLAALQHVMAKSQLVIAMDSFPLHLCGTTATPTISFFGPSSAKKYRPLGEQHQAIQGECPYGIQFEKRCPKLRTCKSGACLKQLSPLLKLKD